jgi:hypothetical protein
MPPVTATAETEVKTAFFNVYRFERIFGSADAFYEAYYEMTMNAMSTSGRFARLGSEDRKSSFHKHASSFRIFVKTLTL